MLSHFDLPRTRFSAGPNISFCETGSPVLGKKIWLREKATKAANPMGDLGRQTAITISHVRASARRSCLSSPQTGQNAAGSLQRYKFIQANSIAVSYLTDGAQGYSEEFDLEGGADG